MRHSRNNAFSLVEVLLALSVAGILAFLAFVTIARVVGSAKEQKLTSDVETLNRAVMAYIASGGDIGGKRSADEVLEAMKRHASSPDRTPGFSGAVVDPRIAFVYEDSGQASAPARKIYWNAATRRFEIDADRADRGIVAISLDGVEPAGDLSTDRSNPMLYSKEGNWIWDYSDVPLPEGKGISEINVNPTPDTKAPATPVNPPRTSTRPLDPPHFSIAGGEYPRASFALSLKLSDPNPSGAGVVYYSVNYGNWIRYSSPISVDPGDVVAGQTVSMKEEFTSSARVEQIYRLVREPLSAPSILLSAAEFTDTLDTIGVRLTNPNPAGSSVIHYVLVEPGKPPGDRGAWLPYKGDFVALSTQYPAGFTIHAYAKAVDPAAFIDSSSVEAGVGANFTFDDPGDGNVLYVIDASGSMRANVGGTTRFRLVQDSLIDAIGRLRPGTKFNVVTFAGNIVWQDGSWDLKLATEEYKKLMIAEVNRFKTASGTNYEAALSAPLRFRTKPDQVFFLTDGEPTGSSQFQDDVAALAKAGIKVNTIGVDLSDAGEQRLAGIAKATGGSATTVSTK